MSNIKIYLEKGTQLQGLKTNHKGLRGVSRQGTCKPSKEVGESVNLTINFFTFYSAV